MTRLIVMLTSHDVTVANAADCFEQLRDLPVECFGFKDVGLPARAMESLVRRLADAGKQVFLEVVSLAPERMLAAAALARTMGVHYLLGSAFSEAVQATLAGQVSYLPFVGRTAGHPTRLAGSLAEIVADGRRLADRGVDGLDLLAYRHDDRRLPARLVPRLARTVPLPLVVAGSLGSLRRIRTVCAAGVWAFTVGTALFEGSLVPGGTLRQQVLAAWEARHPGPLRPAGAGASRAS